MKKVNKFIIALVFTLSIIIIGIVIYQNINKKVLCGYYSSEYNYDINTYGYLKLKEDGTFSYRISVDMSVAIHGNYSVEDDYLILDSNLGKYKFEIQYKKLKFVEGDFIPCDLVEQGDIYKWNAERKYTEDYKREQKVRTIIKNLLIVFVLTTLAEACEVLYKRNRRRLLYGFYYNKKKNEYIEIKEDGTFSYVTTSKDLIVHGNYNIEKYCLTLSSEDYGAYKFEIQYKSLKFMESKEMADKTVKKNKIYKWSAEQK